MNRIVIARGDLVLADRIVEGGSIVIEGDRIASVHTGRAPDPEGATIVDARGSFVVPGFVDLHVHGIEGHDTLDAEGDALAAIASRLPRYGVTAFCPTTIACAPGALRRVLEQVRARGRHRDERSARVLPAHLESNFINPEFCGAQPLECLRAPRGGRRGEEGEFPAEEILETIAAFRAEVGIVTLAPELDGGMELVKALAGAGHRVSLGHSGADFATANAAIDAGARHATHLFNRMPPLAHRAPGLAGAVLNRDEVAVELICDGYHVHPAVSRLAIAAKSPSRVMAITDGTAGSGLPVGSPALLGGRRIHVRQEAAVLDDGTLAGSTLTMNRAFATIVRAFGRTVVDAARMCATTPARELGLQDLGAIADGSIADVVVMDAEFRVTRTFIDGRMAFERVGHDQPSNPRRR